MRIRRLIALAGLTLLLGGASDDNAIVFDRAWALVDRHYWDRSFGGTDWPALRDRYRSEALAAPDQAALYATLNGMLSRIGDSHVYARSAADLTHAQTPPQRESREIAAGIWLLRFDSFMPDDERWLRRAVASTRAEILILDLRANGGGRDDVLDRIAGLFLPAGTPLLRGRTIERATGKPIYSGHLLVLIGPRTASAAELLTAALRNGGAITIGQRSKGAVTGGADYRLPDGGRLTVAEYDVRLPDGTRLEKIGIMPQHRIDDRAGIDAPLACALHLARGGAAC